jgi:hypothetical protein
MQTSAFYSVPDILSFQFKNVRDGSTTKLTFYSAMKMNDFVSDVKEKIRHIHNIGTSEKIDIIEADKGENGLPLDGTDDLTLLRDRYSTNYKYISFYYRIN